MRIGPAELVVEILSLGNLAGPGESLAVEHAQLVVTRIVFKEDLERQRGGARKISPERGFREQFVSAGVGWVGVENLLGGLESLKGIVAQAELAFGNHGGRTGTTDHFFKEAAGVAVLFVLRGAKGLAAIEEAGFALEHLLEDRQGIIEILALESGCPFLIELTKVPGHFVHTFFWHDTEVTTPPGKIHCKHIGNAPGATPIKPTGLPPTPPKCMGVGAKFAFVTGEMKQHIMVVDDEVQIRELLAIYLNKKGYYVSTAGNGTEALKLAGKAHVDLVVLDISLAGEDGLNVLATFKSRHPQTKVVMLTGMGFVEDLLQE